LEEISMKRLTIAAAKKAIPEGISLRKVDSEYRVTFDGAETIKRYGLGANPESFAYYTDDLHDAVETAQAMIKSHRVSSHVSAHVAHERKETAAYEHAEHKRGPGRPRKVASEPATVKRGPGRPRKVVAEAEPAPVKRGPGRPRKVVSESDLRAEYEANMDLYGPNDSRTISSRNKLGKYLNDSKPIAKKRTETPEEVRARMEKVRAARKSGK
jgi:hypothetical protein